MSKLNKKNKGKMPEFPAPPKEDGINSGKEKPKKLKLTKEQLDQAKIQQQQEITMQQQELLQNPGIFRLNLLNLITKQNDISIELGQSIVDELKNVTKALQNLADDPK